MRNGMIKGGAVALALAFTGLTVASARADDFDRHEMRHHMMHRMMRHEMMRHEMRHEMMRHEMRHEMRRHMMHRMMRHEMHND